MRGISNFTTVLVVLIGAFNLCHAFDISTFETDENDFNFDEIDFDESAFVADNGTDGAIDKDIEEDSKLDTVRILTNGLQLLCVDDKIINISF